MFVGMNSFATEGSDCYVVVEIVGFGQSYGVGHPIGWLESGLARFERLMGLPDQPNQIKGIHHTPM